MTPRSEILPLFPTRECRKCHNQFSEYRCPACNKEKSALWKMDNAKRIAEMARRRYWENKGLDPQPTRKEAREAYLQNPNKCKQCGESIYPVAKESLYSVKGRLFCGQKCFRLHRKENPLIKTPSERKGKVCIECGELFLPVRGNTRKTCGQECLTARTKRTQSKEELLRRGLTDPAKCRENRKKQLHTEEGIAEELRGDGWEIFSPTVVCDRIGVKDGKVFFLEFKPIKNQKLRPGQRRIADLVPDMYQIIAR